MRPRRGPARPRPPSRSRPAQAARARLALRSDGRQLTARVSPRPAEPGACMVPAAQRQQSGCGAGAQSTATGARAWRRPCPPLCAPAADARLRPPARLCPGSALAVREGRGDRGGRGRGGGARRQTKIHRAPAGAGPDAHQPIRVRLEHGQPMGAGGSRVIKAWLRCDRAGRDAARVLVRGRGGA